MYKHMQANAVFNIIYSGIKLLSLMNICIFPRSSFCSRVYKLESSQYFKIYAIYFLGNAIRLCANFSYISFSISRYFLSTSNPSKFFQKFQNMNIRAYYARFVLLSMCLSAFRPFQFAVNNFYYDIDKSYPLDVYGVNFCQTVNPYFHANNHLKCRLFNTLTIINSILHNIVFLVISVFIDIGLIRFTNLNLQRKRALFASQEVSPALAQAKKLKVIVNKMIVTNGLLYFVSHAPEFVTTVLLFIFGKHLSELCMTVFSCVELNEMAQVFNFVSLSLQFFVFTYFDKNFRLSLRNLTHRLLHNEKSIT